MTTMTTSATMPIRVHWHSRTVLVVLENHEGWCKRKIHEQHGPRVGTDSVRKPISVPRCGCRPGRRIWKGGTVRTTLCPRFCHVSNDPRRPLTPSTLFLSVTANKSLEMPLFGVQQSHYTRAKTSHHRPPSRTRVSCLSGIVPRRTLERGKFAGTPRVTSS